MTKRIDAQPTPAMLADDGFAVLGTAHPALAQDAFPDRPIRLIVPFPPGGPTDVMGRLIGQSLSASTRPAGLCRQPAGRRLDTRRQMAASADPDGYTLLVGSAATLAIGPALYPDAGFNPKSLVPVAHVFQRALCYDRRAESTGRAAWPT